MFRCTLTSVLGLALVAAAATIARAQESTSALQPYLMDEAREVALARSAATPAISDGAAVYVLRPEGYQLHSPGENGFACLVQRSFSVPTSDPAEFHEPRLLAPICYAPDAAATLMQRDLFLAPLVAGNLTQARIREMEAEAYASGKLKYPDTAVFAYMLSSAQWLGPQAGHWHPHVMVWAPGVAADDVMPEGVRTFGLTSGLPIMDARFGPKQTLIAIPVAPSIAVTPAWKPPTP